MPNRDFKTWLSGFRDSIANYGYHIDFEKVYKNVMSTMIYGIETNFYGSSGSKLNETARSYKTLF